MKYIYVDSLFLLSLFTDYLLCLITGRFCGLYLKRIRYFMAALFGAVYSVCVFLPGLSFLAMPVMELVSAGIMGLIAFGGETRLFRCMGVFLAVSATFGGAVWALTLHAGETPKMDMRLLFLCFAGCYLGLSLVSRMKLKKSDKHTVTVELRLAERKACFTALVDTGNCLSDPVTGAAVMIVSPRALSSLFPGEQDILKLHEPVEMMERAAQSPVLGGRLRLLPYKALSGEGMLPVFRPDEVMVEGKTRAGLLVGISAAASDYGFDAIIP